MTTSHRPSWSWKFRFYLRFLFFVFSFFLIVVAALWAAHPSMFVGGVYLNNPVVDDVNTKSQFNSNKEENLRVYSFHYSRYVALSVLLLCLFGVGVVVFGNNSWWSTALRDNFRLLLFVAFTKIPIKAYENAIVPDIYDERAIMESAKGPGIESNASKKR